MLAGAERIARVETVTLRIKDLAAFDIAGGGVANIEGLQRAFDLCVRMASHRA